MGGRTARWRDILAIAQRAEQAGFDSLRVADHMAYEFPPGEAAHGLWEAWTLLTAVAASTERIELGPLVACTGFRNPALLAKMADTLEGVEAFAAVLDRLDSSRPAVPPAPERRRPHSARCPRAGRVAVGLVALSPAHARRPARSPARLARDPLRRTTPKRARPGDTRADVGDDHLDRGRCCSCPFLSVR
jgi:Luciferase-like monooxygenase